MRRVYKYRFRIVDAFELELPHNATILHVDSQGDDPRPPFLGRLWALVDPTAPTETRRFRIVGTGHELGGTCEFRYIGTFQLFDGGYVGHVFEMV